MLYECIYVDFSIQILWDHNLKASSQDHVGTIELITMSDYTHCEINPGGI